MWNSTQNKKHSMQFKHVLGTFCAVTILLLGVPTPPAKAQGNGIESLRKTGEAFAAVAKKVSPAVVSIKAEKMGDTQQTMEFFSPSGGQRNPFDDDFGASPFGNDFFKHFFPQGRLRPYRQAPNQSRRIVGQGSGFIISDDGYILTNNHMVGDADKVTVILKDGQEFAAKTIGTDPRSDVAVIKIDADNLPVLALGDSDALDVGEWVLAVGNPFGLSHTLTAGIVSAKERSSVGIADYENFIQTDAAINPGNSGGPLVDLNGKAIGMNTAIFSRSGGYMGIGFAIPINMAKAIKDQLIKTGNVTRGYLGIVIQGLTPELAKSFGLDEHRGILIAEVTEDSPAQKAGLKQGDIIVEFDGKAVEQVGEFRNRVSLKAPGTKEKITVLRNGKRQMLTVTIGKLQDSDLVASTSSHHTLDKLGLTVQTLTPDLADRFGYKGEKGVVVTQVNPGSVAAQADIQPGTLIKEVNRKQINNVDEFKQAIRKSENGTSVLLLIKDKKYSRYVVLNIEE